MVDCLTCNTIFSLVLLKLQLFADADCYGCVVLCCYCCLLLSDTAAAAAIAVKKWNYVKVPVSVLNIIFSFYLCTFARRAQIVLLELYCFSLYFLFLLFSSFVVWSLYYSKQKVHKKMKSFQSFSFHLKLIILSTGLFVCLFNFHFSFLFFSYIFCQCNWNKVTNLCSKKKKQNYNYWCCQEWWNSKYWLPNRKFCIKYFVKKTLWFIAQKWGRFIKTFKNYVCFVKRNVHIK